MKSEYMKGEHMNGKPNGIDDDPVNRGTTGQSLRDKGQHYDPATGKPTDTMSYEGCEGCDMDADDMNE